MIHVHAKDQNVDEPVRLPQFMKEQLKSQNHEGGRRNAQTRPPMSNVGIKQVTVEKIHINGLQKTKDQFVIGEVKDIFTAKNFKELIAYSTQAKTRLEKLGIFKDVSVFIDISKGATSGPDGLEVSFDVVEVKPIIGSTHATVGNNEGNLVFGIKMQNLSGRADKLEGNYSWGTKNLTAFLLNYTKPIGKSHDAKIDTSLYKTNTNNQWSGYVETGRGLATEITVPSMLGTHSVRWDGVWREVRCPSHLVSYAVRQECGHSLKSSLKHVFVADGRDNPVLPSQGAYFKIEQEIAGFKLGGDASYLKQQIETEINFKLFWDCVLSAGMKGGIMKTTDGQTSHIGDRFFLGGPSDLRGFQMNGVGPHSEGDSLGGEAYVAAGVHLYTPLPFIRRKRGTFTDLFRTHLFAVGGNLCNLRLDEETIEEHYMRMRETFRWSYGAGLVLRLGRFARFELNYVLPMRAQPTDRLNNGLQFSVGVNYL